MNFIISVFAFIGAFFTAMIVVREFKLWLMRRKAKKFLEGIASGVEMRKDGDIPIEKEEV